MKPLKITLAVLVLIAIGSGIFFWVQNTKPPVKIKAPENVFTKKIEAEIEQLKAKPDNNFCKDFYIEVAYHIEEFYKPFLPKYPFGRFGNTQSENDQWKENFESRLYNVYTEKFINQAKTIFRGSEWRSEDLKFIQDEKNELKRSKLLITGSPVDKDFTTIQTALSKYNEIVSFISSCKGFNFTGTSLSDRFPSAEVKSKIFHSASLLKNGLENEYVNNCTALHNGLKQIPEMLFRKHVLYLENKIEYWSNMWCNYISHKDYSQNLNTPLRNEINELGNSTIYIGVIVDSQYKRLLQKWGADNQKAYNATYPCK